MSQNIAKLKKVKKGERIFSMDHGTWVRFVRMDKAGIVVVADVATGAVLADAVQAERIMGSSIGLAKSMGIN